MTAVHPSPQVRHHRPVSAPSPRELLKAAEGYVEAGLSIVPAGVSGPYAKHPHYSALKKTGHSYHDEDGEHATWMVFQERQPTLRELRAWFLTYGALGIALVTGDISRIVGLDFDGGPGVALMERLGITPHVRSPSGGYHAYLPHPGWSVPTTNAKIKQSLPKGLDVRGEGGLLMLPPSVTDVGRYERLSAKKLVGVRAIPEEYVVEEEGEPRTYRLRELTGLARTQGDPTSPLLPVQAPVLPERNQGQAEQQVSFHVLIDHALRRVDMDGRNKAGYWLAVQFWHNLFTEDEALALDEYWVSLLPGTNTKGEREAYTAANYRASVRSAYGKGAAGRTRRPWEKGYGR